MDCAISIIDPSRLDTLTAICAELGIPVALSLIGFGTATKRILDLLGLESTEKRVVVTIADAEKTAALIRAQRRRLYIDAPGNGVVVAVPLKSVGGAKTLNFLSGGAVKMEEPKLNFQYELILAIANKGSTDVVMDAARAAGARGGTVLHAKGTGSAADEKFFSVSIAQEKELVLIVSPAEEKAAIMSSILRNAGPDTAAGALVMSLPISASAGFSMGELGDVPAAEA